MYKNDPHPLLQLQYHKSGNPLIRASFALFGHSAADVAANVRKGHDINLCLYRVVVKIGPSYPVIAASDDWGKLSAEFQRLCGVVDQVVQNCEDPTAKANAIVSWAIAQVVEATLSEHTTAVTKTQKIKEILDEIRSLDRSLPPVLVQLKEGQLRAIESLGKSDPASLSAEDKWNLALARLRLGATHYYISDVILKLRTHQNMDSWLGRESKEIVASGGTPAPTPVVSSPASIRAEQHPRYGMFFRMLEYTPREIVKTLMLRSNLNPDVLDNPAMLTASEVESKAPQPQSLDLDTSRLRPAPARVLAPPSNNSGVLQGMQEILKRRISIDPDPEPDKDWNEEFL